MHRLTVTICVLILSAAALTACGSEDEDTSKADQTEQSAVTPGEAEATLDQEENQMVGEAEEEGAAADAGAPGTMEPEVAGGSDVSPPTDAEVAAGEAVGEAEADAEKMQAEANAASEEEGAAADAGEAGTMTPEEAVKNTPQGELKNPYTDYQSVAEEGHKLYMGLSCNGCHGGTGGGGMCPPLTNPVWVYGADDDTLFRIVTVGSDGLQKDYGMTRKGSENVVGPMPAMGSAIKSEDDLWKIIAWIRSVNPDSLKEKKPPPMPEGLE